MRDSVAPFPTDHTDLVLDVKYDFYGKQLATCSADQYIKVYDLRIPPPSEIPIPNGHSHGHVHGLIEDPNETQHDEFNSGSPTWVLNDSFKAHDSTIVKLDYASPEYGHLLLSISYDRTMKIWQEETGDHNLASAGSGLKWGKLASLEESHGPLYDGCFLPAHMGLKCCSIGSDFKLRIYDASDPSNLKQWSLVDEIDVFNGSNVLPVRNYLQSDFNISWCPSRFSADKFVISSLDRVSVYYKDPEDGKFKLGCHLHEEEKFLVRSVSWAPSMGRSYHLIATASIDGTMRIFKVSEHFDKSPTNDGSLSYNVETLGEFNDHGSAVWRVNWNMTGTILSTCGDDGTVRLYKAVHANNFKCMSVISAKSQEE